jgi:hypothetical protein
MHAQKIAGHGETVAEPDEEIKKVTLREENSLRS